MIKNNKKLKPAETIVDTEVPFFYKAEISRDKSS